MREADVRLGDGDLRVGGTQPVALLVVDALGVETVFAVDGDLKAAALRALDAYQDGGSLIARHPGHSVRVLPRPWGGAPRGAGVQPLPRLLPLHAVDA